MKSISEILTGEIKKKRFFIACNEDILKDVQYKLSLDTDSIDYMRELTDKETKLYDDNKLLSDDIKQLKKTIEILNR